MRLSVTWTHPITYVVLVWEHEEPARDVARLQHVEHGQALSDTETVVQLVVDDQHGRLPAASVPSGIPLLVSLALLPERAAKVVLREEELLGGPLAQGRKDAVVADNGLELSAKRVALYPVYFYTRQ